jgi:hypothetical protein
MWHAWKREKYMPSGFYLRKLNEKKKERNYLIGLEADGRVR